MFLPTQMWWILNHYRRTKQHIISFIPSNILEAVVWSPLDWKRRYFSRLNINFDLCSSIAVLVGCEAPVVSNRMMGKRNSHISLFLVINSFNWKYNSNNRFSKQLSYLCVITLAHQINYEDLVFRSTCFWLKFWPF